MRRAVCILAGVAAAACAAPAKGGGVMKLVLASSAFTEGGMIPAAHTCDGPDLSPPLAWSGAPSGTKSFALICDDPDAPRGTWVHWVIFNIPADSSSLPAGVPSSERLESGARQGVSDFGRTGYGGPCPPAGTHRYFFTLYALDAKLDLPGRATKEALLGAMKGRILAECRLMGKYCRR